MNLNASSSSGMKTSVVSSAKLEPVTEIGQIPFALCEIVALAEGAGQAEIALLADSMLNVILGCGSLSALQLPQEAKDEIAAIVARCRAA